MGRRNMNGLDRYRLTDEEQIAIFFDATNQHRTVAEVRRLMLDAATEKALHQVMLWLWERADDRRGTAAQELAAVLKKEAE